MRACPHLHACNMAYTPHVRGARCLMQHCHPFAYQLPINHVITPLTRATGPRDLEPGIRSASLILSSSFCMQQKSKGVYAQLRNGTCAFGLVCVLACPPLIAAPGQQLAWHGNVGFGPQSMSHHPMRTSDRAIPVYTAYGWYTCSMLNGVCVSFTTAVCLWQAHVAYPLAWIVRIGLFSIGSA